MTDPIDNRHFLTVESFDLDSVAALISMGPHYLLQHREDRDGVAFPNCWGLFGGALEHGESTVAALRRELLEELELEVCSFRPLLCCTYDCGLNSGEHEKPFLISWLTKCRHVI